MITLITGTPGSGKSSLLVQLMRAWAKEGRPLFVDGVPELQIPHTAFSANTWPTAVPDGACVVIDEVQRVWRPMGPGQRVPDDIAQLETHRHRGLDFLIVSQGPKLVHANVRALVGRHIHLRDLGFLGRRWYEWPEAADINTWRSAPFSKKYKLDKTTFAAYKSSSEHIKPVRSFPRAVILAVAAILLFIGLVVYGVSKIGGRVSDAQTPGAPGSKAPVGVMAGNLPGGAPGAPGANSPFLRNVRVHPGELAQQFTARLPDRPETAPAYDHLRQVVVMPRTVGGWCEGSTCRCYTQQGTRAELSGDACAQWVADPPFDPYHRRMPAPERSGPDGGAAAAPVPVPLVPGLPERLPARAVPSAASAASR